MLAARSRETGTPGCFVARINHVKKTTKKGGSKAKGRKIIIHQQECCQVREIYSDKRWEMGGWLRNRTATKRRYRNWPVPCFTKDGNRNPLLFSSVSFSLYLFLRHHLYCSFHFLQRSARSQTLCFSSGNRKKKKKMMRALGVGGTWVSQDQLKLSIDATFSQKACLAGWSTTLSSSGYIVSITSEEATTLLNVLTSCIFYGYF